jgi:hypothetical protein
MIKIKAITQFQLCSSFRKGTEKTGKKSKYWLRITNPEERRANKSA